MTLGAISSDYLAQMGVGFALTIAVEGTILLAALTPVHPLRRRLFAGFWLTACTYPVVWLVIPALWSPYSNRGTYLAVAETFAPVAECALFWLAFDWRGGGRIPRDMAAIVVANLASFGVGELVGRLI